MSEAAARLVLALGQPPQPTVFALEGEAVVGRAAPETDPPEIDLAPWPEATHVSRRHARLWLTSDGWRVQDLGSANHTYLRRAGQAEFVQLASSAALAEGDELAFGTLRASFHQD